MGQAIFGLREDLQLTGNRYSFSAAIFFLGFIAGAYPASQLAQRYPVERVAGGLVLIWGICFILTPACTNYQGLYAQRFFLGALEAGISPIFMLIVGQFYKKDEQALMMGSVHPHFLPYLNPHLRLHSGSGIRRRHSSRSLGSLSIGV
jgi:MFS family permease